MFHIVLTKTQNCQYKFQKTIEIILFVWYTVCNSGQGGSVMKNVGCFIESLRLLPFAFNFNIFER